MRGFLWIEEEHYSISNGTFKKIFCFSSYCALQYRHCPSESDGEGDLDEDSGLVLKNCGYVYGGDIYPSQVKIMSTIEYYESKPNNQKDTSKLVTIESNMILLYPFEVTVSSPASVPLCNLKLTLACENEIDRSLWVQNIEEAIFISSFKDLSKKYDMLPYTILTSAVRESDESSSLTINNCRLPKISYQVILQYYMKTYPDGLMLQAIHLENVNLDDNAISSVCAIIDKCNYLNSLSLAGNLLTSNCIPILSESLRNTSYLSSLNISNNFFSSDNHTILLDALSNLTCLQYLNISRNRFSSEMLSYCMLRLVPNLCNTIRIIDVSCNPFGNQLVAFISLLLYHQPSTLHTLDMSYSNIDDIGLQELTLAIPYCTTLQNLILKGCFSTAGIFKELFVSISKQKQELISKSKSKYLPVHQDMNIVIGGVLHNDQAEDDEEVFENENSDFNPNAYNIVSIPNKRRLSTTHGYHSNMQCMTFKSLQTALPYLPETSLLQNGIIRRTLKVPYALASSIADEFNPVIYSRVTLPQFVSCAEEVLLLLAAELRADPQQFRLLSVSVDQISSEEDVTVNQEQTIKSQGVRCFVIWTICNISSRRQLERLQLFSAKALIAQKNTILKSNVNQSSKFHSEEIKGYHSLNVRYTSVFHRLVETPSIASLTNALKAMAFNSHPFLRTLGFSSIYMQYYPNNRENYDFADPTKIQDIYRKLKLQTCNYRVFETNSLGRGLLDEYIGIERGREGANVDVMSDMISSKLNISDNKPFEVSFESRFERVNASVGAFEGDDTPFRLLRRVKNDHTIAINDKSDLLNGRMIPQEEVDEMATLEPSIIILSDELDAKEDDKTVALSVVEANEVLMKKEAIRRHKQITNERLILAVRKLYASKEITNKTAKFWEGVFGNLKYKSFAKAELRTAIDYSDANSIGVFKGIRRRQLLCDAMFRRDQQVISDMLEECQQLGKIGSGTISSSCFILAQRLVLSMVGLQHQHQDLSLLTSGVTSGSLSVVEDYLLKCGRIGYQGNEVIDAVSIRQRIVEELVNEMEENTLNNYEIDNADAIDLILDIIQYKALISNLIISRNIPELQSKLREVNSNHRITIDDASIDDNSTIDSNLRNQRARFLSLPETIEAEILLKNYDNSLIMLKNAIKNRNIDELEDAISTCAFHCFYCEEVEDANRLLNELSGNPYLLLVPILTGLRENNIGLIEQGFDFINRMEWQHVALDMVVCSKIHAIKAKIVQDDSLKAKLVKCSLALKNGFEVRPAEISQLLRRAEAIGLNDDPNLSLYLKVNLYHLQTATA
eukprot:gene4522-6387_t